MRDYKAFTIQYMFEEAQRSFDLTPQNIIFPQLGDEEKWEAFTLWALNSIMGDLRYPVGEFMLRYGNMIARVMTGQVLACDITLDPEAFWRPSCGIKAGIEPFPCPKCKTLMDLDENQDTKRESNPVKVFPPARRCPGCGYYCAVGSEDTFKETP
jgi:hypothetical protein